MLISCAATTKMICFFVFAYAKCRFSHDVAHIVTKISDFGIIFKISSLNIKRSILDIYGAPPGVLGIWGEGPFIFRELGSTANYFRGAGEQAYTFWDLGSTAKK